MSDLFEATRSATLSPCGTLRLDLWRRVGIGEMVCLFIMLNPSLADADLDDPTIRACMEFVRRWGFGWLRVVNLFALRTPHPERLMYAADPIGRRNDEMILAAARDADFRVAAWGKHGAHLGRAERVRTILAGMELHVLGLNADGSPRHPLYIPRTTAPVLWSMPA